LLGGAALLLGHLAFLVELRVAVSI
jgi:hypothetical protein